MGKEGINKVTNVGYLHFLFVLHFKVGNGDGDMVKLKTIGKIFYDTVSPFLKTLQVHEQVFNSMTLFCLLCDHKI